jgi:hypothetical protein
LTNLAENASFFTLNFNAEEMEVDLESREIMNLSVLPSISKRISDSSETMMGRTLRLWGDTGVITKFFAPGVIKGPPQLKE